jgi:hypothetical protein
MMEMTMKTLKEYYHERFLGPDQNGSVTLVLSADNVGILKLVKSDSFFFLEDGNAGPGIDASGKNVAELVVNWLNDKEKTPEDVRVDTGLQDLGVGYDSGKGKWKIKK